MAVRHKLIDATRRIGSEPCNSSLERTAGHHYGFLVARNLWNRHSSIRCRDRLTRKVGKVAFLSSNFSQARITALLSPGRSI